jgi:hypothetical protein
MNIALILEQNYPNSLWLLNGENYSDLVWLDTEPKPTKAELESLSDETEYKNLCVIVERERQAAYVAESDPLFFKYQRNEDGVTKAAWLAKVDEIRERFPMPES